LPACNCEAMQLHLDEIATKVTLGAHAIILLDQAGWHGAKALVVPNNISLVPLPPRAPELNGQENIWEFMRQNWLSNRIFKSFDDIVDHCCYAWNTLIDQPWKIMSIARRDWARSLNLRIGISHCDSTHGHHPCLLSFAFNVRPSHEFPCMRGTRGRAPCAKGGMRRGGRSLNDA